MSDLRPSCFCGSIIWTESESPVFGIGWLMKQIARTTFPTFLTWRGKWSYPLRKSTYTMSKPAFLYRIMLRLQVTTYKSKKLPCSANMKGHKQLFWPSRSHPQRWLRQLDPSRRIQPVAPWFMYSRMRWTQSKNNNFTSKTKKMTTPKLVHILSRCIPCIRVWQACRCLRRQHWDEQSPAYHKLSYYHVRVDKSIGRSSKPEELLFLELKFLNTDHTRQVKVSINIHKNIWCHLPPNPALWLRMKNDSQ